MNLKRIIFALAVCLMLAAIPALAETYTCDQQGFTVEYDPANTVLWEDGNGVVVYTGESGYIPFAMVWRIGTGSGTDFSEQAFFASYTQDMRESYGDALRSVEDDISIGVDGEQVPGIRYIYELQGHEVELVVFLHKAGDSVRQFTAKYLREDYESSNRTIDALLTLVRSFKLTDGAAHAPQSSSIDNTLTGANNAKVYNCEQQGFSFAYDPAYTVEWEDENGAVIYTKSVGSIPYAIVWQSEDLIAEPLEYIKEQLTPLMVQRYGDDLVARVEYGGYDIGGKQLPAGLYTYKLQGYLVNLLRIYDSTGKQTVAYSAKYIQGDEQATLAALDLAIRSYKQTGTADDPS